MCGAGLAGAGDVVQFAFDGQQRGARDVLRAHQLAVHLPVTVDQGKVLKHRLDRVEVILRRHVEYGVVLIVELPVSIRAVIIASHQVEEVVVMRAQMPVRVHRDEAGVLQKTGVDRTACCREVARHLVDHIGLEPFVAAVHRQVVDRSRAAARVDRAAHHRHAQRRSFAMGRHQRNCGQHRHGGLAHRDHMAFACTDMSDEFLYIADVVIEVKRTGSEGHHAGIGPVCDVHLVVLQQLLDRVAQQGAVMAG